MAMRLNIRWIYGLVWLLALHGLVWACSKSNNDSLTASSPSVTYAMDRIYTNQTTDTLIIQTNNATKDMLYSISGSGFTANVDFNTVTAINNYTSVTYTDTGIYTMALQFYLSDGTPFIKDSLLWQYSNEVPADPIPGFLEGAASKTIKNTITLAGGLSTNTNEMWISGDIASSDPNANNWIPIPSSLQVPISTTSADGTKNITVKYRNIFGTESKTVTDSLLKVSTAPTSCFAELSSSTSANATTRITASANVSLGISLSYLITGDLETPQTTYKTFTSPLFTTVTFTDGSGVKNIVVNMKDEAGNTCAPIPLSYTLDPTSTTSDDTLTFANPAYYTYDNTVALLVNFSLFANESVEMFISGDIDNSTLTNQWVTYQKNLDVSLTSGSGDRFIYADFRDGVTQQSLGDRIQTHINLAPFATMTTDHTAVLVTPFNADTVTYTIVGCQETYTSVAYATSYPCTPIANPITTTFNFPDGSTLVRTSASQ
jgi:hypothetical protein